MKPGLLFKLQKQKSKIKNIVLYTNCVRPWFGFTTTNSILFQIKIKVTNYLRISSIVHKALKFKHLNHIFKNLITVLNFLHVNTNSIGYNVTETYFKHFQTFYLIRGCQIESYKKIDNYLQHLMYC